MSKIPTLTLNVGQICPASSKCPIRQHNECQHQGIKHKARYECHHLSSFKLKKRSRKK